MRRCKARKQTTLVQVARSRELCLTSQSSTGMQDPSRRGSAGSVEPCLCAFLISYVLVFGASSSSSFGERVLVANHVVSSGRISSTDLENRLSLERNIQLAAFQQFGHRKTGMFYNVSFASAPSGSMFQAIRLRLGRFRKDGLNISEFSIPRRCNVNPTPERILLVYARLSGSSLFQGLPEGLALASPVVSVFAYDAANVKSALQVDKLSVAAIESPVSIRFQPLSTGFSNLTCAFFEDNSTAVDYSSLVQNACSVNSLGTFALVGNASGIAQIAPSPPPSLAPGRSNTWKIAVGSVIGGLVLLVLMSLLALGVGKHRRKEKFAKMQFQTDQGETLETASMGRSRAPAAGSTRTQARLEKDEDV